MEAVSDTIFKIIVTTYHDQAYLEFKYLEGQRLRRDPSPIIGQ